uniref:Uncharacterized protein n=1 Tax=Anguilla anguilla TaxID=7936 RepID=A0A0E9X8P4_ANGAN
MYIPMYVRVYIHMNTHTKTLRNQLNVFEILRRGATVNQWIIVGERTHFGLMAMNLGPCLKGSSQSQGKRDSTTENSSLSPRSPASMSFPTANLELVCWEGVSYHGNEWLAQYLNSREVNSTNSTATLSGVLN